jgi:hypothetical protein
MTTTTDELIGMAAKAGQQAHSASKMLRDAITAAYTSGSTTWDAAVIGSMREAFRQAYASNGKTKNAGNMLFARAWDELIAEGLALEARPNKGKGRNAGKAKSDDSDDTSDETAESRKALTADELKTLRADVARELIAAAGIKPDMITAALIAGRELKPYRDGKDKALSVVAGDAIYALSALGRACNGVLKAAGQQVSKAEAAAPADESAKAEKPAKPAKANKSKSAKAETAQATA